MKLKTTSLLIAGTLFGAAMLPAQANNEAMADLLKVLRDKGTISAEDYNMLKNAAAADQEKTEAAQAEVKKQVAEATADMPKITTEGKIKFESRDGSWSFQPIGRVMWDAMSTDGDGGDEYHGSELRRARLGFEGSIYDWDYKFEGDFAEGDTSIKDAFVAYNTKLGGNKANLKMGQSQIAFGFNTAASSKYMTFIDRPFYADKITSPARQSGVVGKLSGDIWSFATSVTQGSIGGGEAEESANGTTVAVRGTVLPYMADSAHLVQLGAGYMTTSSNADKFDFNNHLTAHTDPQKIQARTLNASQFDGSNAYGVDAVGIFGSFHVLAEYNGFTADSNDALGDIDIDSYSVEAGYYLTGESMKMKNGLWDGVSPKNSYGAWQIATRFETTEIDDNAENQQADMWTVGLNYIPVKNIRLMLDYSTVTNFESDNAARDGVEPSAIKFRAQAKW